MHNKEDLEQLVYALTLQDRPTKRHLWLLRGFQITNKKPGFLFSYWDNRLRKGQIKDMIMYEETLERFKRVKNYAEQDNRRALAAREKLIDEWIKSKPD
jgi:hypothetical protein